MIDIPLLLTFIVAASLLTVTPGVDTAMVLRSATVSGLRPALLVSAGIALGCLTWGAAVSLGLGALLRASELAYSVIKFAGAGYLIWLGSKLLLAPRKTLTESSASDLASQDGGAFLRGFLTNLLNPKVGVFYVTFLPQFIPHGGDIGPWSFILACIHVTLTFIWFMILIAAAVPLGGLLRRPTAIRTMDRLTGSVFVAFGVKLAMSRVN